MAFGILLGIAAYEVSPLLAAWMSPVVAGLALAIPLAVLTARRSLGLAFRRLGLLLTPEERDPPPVLARARALLRELRAAETPADGIHRLLDDPALLTAHLAMLPPPRRKGDPIDIPLLTGLAKLSESDTVAEALTVLDAREKTSVLADARGLDRLLALCGAGF
jgi:membrane glycosyltransferase